MQGTIAVIRMRNLYEEFHNWRIVLPHVSPCGLATMTAYSVSRPDPGYHPALQRLFAYWSQCRGDRSMPARADLDPLEMKFALGDITLIDVEPAPLRFRVRLEGTNAVARTRIDMTGRYVDEFPLVEYRAQMIDSYARIVDQKRPDWAQRSVVLDRRQFQYEVLWLPLSDDGENVSMILAYVHYLN